MIKTMDNLIKNYPTRIISLNVDKSKLNLKSLIILTAGYLPKRTLPRYDGIFPEWAIVYITDGKGTYQVNNGAKQTVEKGSLFFFYPGATFHYGPEKDGFWDEYYFRIEGERIQEWLNNWPIHPGIVTPVGSEEFLQNKIDRIFMLMDSNVPANSDLASLLLESMLYESIIRANTFSKNNKHQRIIDIIDNISESLYQPIDLIKIAKRHHISIPTLRRIVSEYTGYPINDYIHRLKVTEAMKILLNTELPLKNISETLGYKDVFYFSRLFKKYVGMPPSIYRSSM